MGGEGTDHRQSREGKAREEMVEGRKTTYVRACDERVRDPKIIPMILNALVSTACSRESCEVGAPVQRGEQYSIRLWMKALYVVRSSGMPRKDFA